MSTLRSAAKQIPGLRALVAKIKNTIKWLRFRSLLPCLYPRSTDKALIRFGPDGDGGYLIPDDLDGIEACFSPGVSSISGFELDCAKRGIRVLMADGSVDSPAAQHPLFEFTKMFVGGTEREGFMMLDDWVTSSVGIDGGDLILQMDIEGYEYEVISSVSRRTLERFRIIVIEFHRVHDLTTEKKRVFEKILDTHSCVHIHPNNHSGFVQLGDLTIPKAMEFSFLRKDRLGKTGFQSDFPHALDCENAPGPSIVLPNCWYKNRGPS